MAIVMCVYTLRVERRSWMKSLSMAAIGTVVAQGALGGLTVLMFLPWYVSSAHAALGQTFFSIAVLLAVFTGRGWIESSPAKFADDGTPATRTLAVLAICAVYLQLFLR